MAFDRGKGVMDDFSDYIFESTTSVLLQGMNSPRQTRWEQVVTPVVGQVVKDKGVAYKLYCEYAHGLGFSVRKEKQYYFTGTTNIRHKDYCCSKRGTKDMNPLTVDTIDEHHSRRDTRTGCEAMISFSFSPAGDGRVRSITEDHIHELAYAKHAHLLWFTREVTDDKRAVLSSIVNSGIRPTDAYYYMVSESGGRQNLGFTQSDCYNYLARQKMATIEGGDVNAVITLFKQRQQQSDNFFFWEVETDSQNRVLNMFWRDGRSKIDYDCFRDIIIFDTTYRTNKYNLVCAPFVRINHHQSNVMFGCGLLVDEKIESFEWLFRIFLQSMGNLAPQTIFTDQDQAITRAIKNVFPSTRHRYCLWHIAKNAPSHFGALESEARFMKMFNKCMYACETKKEFDYSWTQMITTFNLENHKWLRYMYKIQQNWAPACNRVRFDGGTRSSQRSESTNNVFSDLAKRSTNLTELMKGFDNFVER